MAVPVNVGPSSRDSDEGAGWQNCPGPGAWKDDVPAGTRSLSWLRPSTLWQCRNDIIARVFADPTVAARARWVELAARRVRDSGADQDFVFSHAAGDAFSMIVIGDTGEGDNSQYAVARPLTAQSRDVDFVVICSDVIYPTGDRADYGRKFHHPYRDLRAPIYAVPGNHDWYDGLHGFMHYFCRVDDDGYLPDFGRGLKAWLARKLWRSAVPPDPHPAPDPAVPEGERPAPDPVQPAPYFAIDAGPVRFVGIDTGITGEIDEAQYEWLRRVSFDEQRRPKILLTGKPLYVDGEHHPGAVLGSSSTVDDVVRDPDANYVLAIGGDIHNYQRYPVPLPDGRVLQYVVSGGGGAFMHATHSIPPVNINGVDESTFRCYPLRRDSLARFSQVIDRRLGGTGAIAIDPSAAGRFYARRGIITSASDRDTDTSLSPLNWLRAWLVHQVRGGRLFHRFGSEVFDFNDPPFFKQFLRLDVTATEITVACFGVTGCAGTELSPSVEDRFTVSLHGQALRPAPPAAHDGHAAAPHQGAEQPGADRDLHRASDR
ncbi:MAG TPA: metallophosphoesterase [Pseudonocardiaceae bacterium]|jgi:hypothetical protein